ncbi:MAG TPA: alginate lyase family protein [Candidatus Acidoferrum sp.]|nr:alginate lyase family protein [Candidatus Acidoferrum sp.]
MSSAELVNRTRQEFLKRWESAAPPKNARVSGNGISRQKTHFFFSSEQVPSLLESLRKLLPAQVLSIQERAEQICQHRFDLLGYKSLDYGPKIDWHLDAVSGKRAPQTKWYKVPYLSFAEVGDHKVTWELNRHQHLVILAKAFLLTGDQKFTRELKEQWYHWKQQNPYGIGINWSSSLEIGIRAMSWIWVRELLCSTSELGDRFQSDLLQGLAQHGRYVSNYLSTYFSPNTHLIGEAVALLFLGITCPELTLASTWKKTGWEIVQQETERQVQDDGIYFEQSFYYHVYALDFFLHARILAERNGLQVPAALDRKIERMAEALCALGQDGIVPRIGDDDGGRVFDSTRNLSMHTLDPIATAAVLYNRPDFKAASHGFCEESLWLLGEEGSKKFAVLPEISSKPFSRAFESSGFHVMASENPKTKLVVHAGPMGALRAGHSHCDLFALNLSIDGEDCLTDPGTFRYVSDNNERDYFRETAAHNTLKIDGKDQAESSGAFSWNAVPTVQIKKWIQGKSFDLLAAQHSGYERLDSPVSHTRWIFSLKSQLWFVRDVIAGQGQHSLEQSWHLNPNLEWQTPGAAGFAAINRTNSNAVFTLLSESDMTSQIKRAWHSPVYGQKHASSLLHFSCDRQMPSELGIAIVLGDYSQTHLQKFSIPGNNRASDQVTAYCFAGPLGKHYFFFSESSHSWAWNNLSTDAAFFYLCLDSNSEVRQCALCDGTYVEIDGDRIFNSSQRTSSYEWESTTESFLIRPAN